MERAENSSTLVTASCWSTLLSNLPSCGKPTRIMIYDIHALQNQFYFTNNSIADLCTGISLIKPIITLNNYTIAFPDDGAKKRFGSMFTEAQQADIIICGKTRSKEDPSKRTVIIQDGLPADKDIIIIDDMVQSGGTLIECAKVLKAAGAKSINVFVTHAVFPNEAWKKFSTTCQQASNITDKTVCDSIDKIYITNSNPEITKILPQDDRFEILDMTDLIVKDLLRTK
jgi:phosphoribosylpyrophosphate synthetase